MSLAHDDDGPVVALLVGLAAALTLAPDQAMAAAASFVDVDQFQRYWAFCSVIGQFDAFPYSDPGDDYFVYADPVHKLTFLPWGMDETFYSAITDVTVTRSVLAAQCRASAVCYQGYVDRTWDLLALTESIGLEAERVRVAAQIAPYVLLDQRKSYSDAVVAEYQRAMHWFITERRAGLAAMLPPHSP